MLTLEDASLEQEGYERDYRGRDIDDSVVVVSHMHI